MSKNVFDIFTTDKNLEQKGFALEYGESTFIIARAGGANRKFQSLLERKMRPYRAAINSGTMDEETAERLLAEVYAETVILAWDGVPDRGAADGVELPFTKENCVAVLLELRDLFRNIQDESTRLANFIAEGVEEDEKS